MKKLAASDEIYSKPQYLKEQLKKKYGNQIFFATVNNKTDVVCFKETATSTVNDTWYKNRSGNSEDDSKRIIYTAAEILLAEMRTKSYLVSIH